MDRHCGRVHHTPKGLLEPISLLNPMGHSVVQQAALSIHKNGDRSAMALCGCCMQHGLAIVARVTCVSSVKNQRRASKHDASVPCIGRSLPLHRPQMSPHLPQRNLRPHRLCIRSFGEIGHDALIDAKSSNSFGISVSVSNVRNQFYRLNHLSPVSSTAFSCRTSTLPSLLGEAPGMQCSLEGRSRCLNHTLRDTRCLCHCSRSPRCLRRAWPWLE
jgi:hypothetical protein